MSILQAEVWLLEQVAENAATAYGCALAHERLFNDVQLRSLGREAEMSVVEALAMGVPADLLERAEMVRDAGEAGVLCAEGFCPYC